MTERQELRRFGKFKLAGGRYGTPGLPVRVTKELQQYERIIRGLARELYFQEHPHRQRVPRGFDAWFDLRLSDVIEGSVVPLLERAEQVQPVLIDSDDVFERSRLMINDVLRSMSSEQPKLPRGFPTNLLKELSRLGQTLAQDERIELASLGSSGTAVLDRSVREKLVGLAQLPSIEVEQSVTAQITGVRSEPQEFDCRIEGGAKVRGRYSDPAVWEQLTQFQGYGERAPLASLSALIESDLKGQVVGIVDVYSVEAALPTSWADRLSDLAALKTGWLYEDTPAVSLEAIDAAESVLLAVLDEGLPRPGIFPTPEGEMQLEWTHHVVDIELVVPASGDLRFDAMVEDGELVDERQFDRTELDGLLDALKELLQ